MCLLIIISAYLGSNGLGSKIALHPLCCTQLRNFYIYIIWFLST